jgi:hypothetical protein
MLGFVEHLVDWATGVPLLVICTTRPELFERRPGWGGGKRNSTTVSLSPLTREDTTRLITALLAEAVLPGGTQTALLERCGGNPLFAEEFVRMLRDRGVIEQRNGVADIAKGWKSRFPRRFRPSSLPASIRYRRNGSRYFTQRPSWARTSGQGLSPLSRESPIAPLRRSCTSSLGRS